MAAYALTLSLFRLYSTCQQVNTGLLSMRQRIQENQREADYVRSQQKKDFEECALLIAQTLEKHPEYATQENLQELCYVVEAEYIMLFDDQGNETLSNARYLNLSLGRNPSSATYEFRRLLTGTPLITREPAFDEATGENNALIGVSMEQPGKGSYGALLLAVAPDQIDGSSAESVGSIMSSLVAEDMLAFSVSAESGLIVNASDGALEGGYATDLGLPERALRSGYRDFFKLNGLYYYGECEEYDGALYYYAAKSSHIYRHVLSASLIAAAGAFGLMTVLALYMLPDYRRFFAEYSEGGGEALAEPSDMVWLSGGRRKYSRDPAKRRRTGVEEYGIRAPMHLTRITFEVLMTLFIVAIAMMFLLSGSGKRSIITFILRGQWARGVNLFALTNILITLGELFLTVTALKLLLRLISAALGARGETVCRLLTNLVSYAGVIIFVYVALYDLGFNPGTLLASLGLLSFAVSLGAKDLLTDVIAGLSIVFEGDYQVGDIIEVSGYRGEVLEIGVRTTKLEGRGGNIKIIYNRDVKNIVNMTRKNSWCVVELGIDSGQNLDEVERILTRELPAIGEANPKIISGPVYKGFSSITKGVVSLSIIAECNEADYFSVQRALCRALQEIFSAHNIKLI
jgi:small conductance mechanosensitive channel